MAIYLFGDVGPDMALDVCRRLDKNPKRCNFFLNSFGGTLTDGFAIYDKIQSVPNSIITGTGVVASAATVILQAAKIRRATPTTQFMFHLVEFSELKDNKDFKPHYDVVIFELFKNRGIKKVAYEIALNRKIFGVETALKLGFIDEIYDGRVRARPGI
jgi:ATP-dependent protease ClpP protease subunit